MDNNVKLYIPNSEVKRKTIIENNPKTFDVECCTLPIEKKDETLWRDLIQSEIFLNFFLYDQMDKENRNEEIEQKIISFSEEILRQIEAKLHSVFNDKSNTEEVSYIGLTMLEIYELEHYFYRLLKKEDTIRHFATNYLAKLIEILGAGTLEKINLFVTEYIFFKFNYQKNS